jgi:EamA domain-containing membrane protein RarD
VEVVLFLPSSLLSLLDMGGITAFMIEGGNGEGAQLVFTGVVTNVGLTCVGYVAD